MNDTEYQSSFCVQYDQHGKRRSGRVIPYPMLGGKHVGGRAIVSSPSDFKLRHHLPDKTPHSAAAFPFLAGLRDSACFR